MAHINSACYQGTFSNYRKCQSIAPKIATGTVHQLPIIMMQSNNLASAEHSSLPSRQNIDLVTKTTKAFDCLVTDALLHKDGAVGTPCHRGSDANSWGIKGRLGVIPEGKHVEQDLQVALRLHETTHDTINGVQRAIRHIGDQRWYDGVIRALAGSQGIRMPGLEREISTAVLQSEATTGRNDGSAKTSVVTVDEGDAVALLVGDSKVDCVTVVVCRTSMVQDIGGAIRSKQLCLSEA